MTKLFQYTVRAFINWSFFFAIYYYIL